MSQVNTIFKRKAFTQTALTESINRTVRRRKVFDTLFPWRSGEAHLDTVEIVVGNDNTLGIVASLPRDGVPENVDGDKRSVFDIRVPAFAAKATIYNTEAFGVINGLTLDDAIEQSLGGLINDRNDKILGILENTHEHQRAGVFRNKITDRDGRTLLDYKKQFGLEQGTITFDLNDAKKSFRTQLEVAKNIVRERVGDDVVTGFVLLVGSAVYFDKLSSNPEYVAAGTTQEAVRLTSDDLTGGVTIAGVKIVPIFSPNWGPNECKLIPIIDGAFRRLWGRSTSTDYWGTILPYYTTTNPLAHGFGLEMQTWSHVIHYYTHPDAIQDVTFS